MSATLPPRSAGTDDVVHWWSAALREPHRAVAPDHVYRTLDSFAVVLERAIGARDGAVGIREQREVEAELLDVTLVAFHPGRVHPQRLDFGGSELGYLVAHGGELAVSARGVVARIEHERHTTRFEQLRERI